MSEEFNQDNLIGIFLTEASEGIAAIATAVNPTDGTLPTPPMIQEHFITAHRIRGAAALYGYEGIAVLAERLEKMCEQAVQISSEVWPQIVEAIRETVQGIQALVNAIGVGAGEDQATVKRCLAVSESWASAEAILEGAESPFSEAVADQTTPVGTLRPESDTDHHSASSDEYFLPQLDPGVLSYFMPEAQEYLESLEANLLQLDKQPQNKELIQQLFRTAHTLKGSAYTVGFQAIGDLVHHVEDFMGAVRDQRFRVLPGHTDSILRSIDVVRVLMRNDPNVVHVTRQRFEASLSELKRLDSGSGAETFPASGFADAPVSSAGVEAGLGEEQGAGHKHPEGKSGDEREVVRVSHARLEQLMNLVGELVIGRGRLEQRLLALERLSEQVVACKTRLVDAIQSFADKHTFTFHAAPPAQADPATSTARGFGDFGALELDKYDDFNILARRIGEVSADITESMAQLSGSIRHAHDDMSQLQHLTRNMRDEIARTRMIPIGTPFTRFRRAVREMARSSKKEVALVTSGEHTQVDTGVVERLVDPLVHLVRNAVYHGIELPADRIAKGKPATGTIYLHAAHRGNSILVEVEDDGAGLDLARIREKAVAIGLAALEQVQRMPDAEALQFIFAPGFSTAKAIGDQAGRGVGLDVVKRVVEGMNGHIEVESLPDVGTKFTLRLPLTLLITTALLVRAGAERYAIALSSIREVTLATGGALTKTDGRTILSLGEEMIEMHSLFHLLHGESADIDSLMPVVIVRTASGLMGLAVDELLGRHEIVIKRLGTLRPLEQSCFGGATIDPQGRVILVIDPSRLGARPAAQPAMQIVGPETKTQTQNTSATETADAVASILLIDDSLSIRKFIGKMLESAGYVVDTAVDGEDGLRKASQTRYRLIITDLEMPKFNGYEVVQALRGRPLTKQTPIVVMTTRAGEKHRQLAADIGVNAYIAKPVDERTLFQVVERWVGRTPAVST